MPASSTGSAVKPAPKRPLRLRINTSLRWLHTYLSMFTMLVVLFFAVTGITLNHPDWTFGMDERTSETKGTLPKEWIEGKEIRWLDVAERMRTEHRVHGVVGNYTSDDQEGSLTFKAPGYSADMFFDRHSGEYTLTEVRQGFMAVANDFHRGRDAGPGWSLMVDLSGFFLAIVSLTGFGIMLYLKKIRTKSLVVAGIGVMLMLVLMYLAN